MQERERGVLLGFVAGVGICLALHALRGRRKHAEGESESKATLGAFTKIPINDSPSERGPLRPHQHEAKMQARIQGSPDKLRERIMRDNSNSNTLREAIREEVIQGFAVEREKVTVRVPATSANMGPGFDCLGLAVNIWCELTVERSDKFEIIYKGEGAEQLPLDESNLMVTGMKAAFEAAGKPLPTLRYICDNRIPFARGMGSSSAAIVSGLIAGLILAGHRLPCWGAESLLQLACAIEGHPDNVAPVIYGGCQLGIFNGERWVTERVSLPSGIQIVMFIPDFIGKTSDARGVLKDQVSRKDAVYSIQRVAWLVNALATGNLDNLRDGCDDRMHQPQRAENVYKYLDPMIKSAMVAGAHAAYLSGAGPTVAAITSGASGDIFTQREAERVDKVVAEAMLAEAERVGVKGQIYITQPIESGAYVVSADPPFSEGIIKYERELHHEYLGNNK